MNYYAYILYSSVVGKFYRGQTNDMLDRMRRHNNRLVSSTKSGVPWMLVWYTEKESRTESFLLEQKLKNLSRKRLIAFMLKYSRDIQGKEVLEMLHQMSIDS